MTKFILTLFCLCFFIPAYPVSDHEVLNNHIRNIQRELVQELREEYGFVYRGGHATYPNDIEIWLQIRSRVSLEEARHLIVYFTERFLEKLETDERTQHYWEKKISTPDNICIVVAIYNPIDCRQCDGSISSLRLVKCKVHYDEDDAFLKTRNEYVEPYEDAKRTVESTRPFKPKLHQDSPLEAAFDGLTRNYAINVAEKFQLGVFNIGREKGDQLKRIEARMSRYAKAKEKKARVLLVNAVEHLLAMVHADEDLEAASFSADQIHMRIDFRNKNGYSFAKNSLQSIEIKDGTIEYIDLKNTPRLTESYAEAKAKCKR